MKRTDLLNHLIQKHGLKRYLEIGLQDATQNFDKIHCEYKISVDPDPSAHASFQLTSDDFFDSYTEFGFIPFDLIFIDGLHTAEQVQKDFENALKVLSPNGFIVLHDCNPLLEEHTIVPRPTERGHWNGSVYKFAIIITSKYVTNDRAITVDIDNGMVVFRSGQRYDGLDIETCIPWSVFDKNRKELLNLITWDEFISIGSHV